MLISISEAIDILNNQGVVALPTETVYGLAARIDSHSSLEAIFKTKHRPFFDPLIVHVLNLDEAMKLSSSWNKLEIYLAKKFWPGPFTLIKEKTSAIDEIITAGKTKVALRSPAHKIFQEVLKKISCPLAAPSANIFKSTSPTTAQHVEDEFQGKVPVVDGGNCAVGIESTVMEVIQDSEYKINIYRPGMITLNQIKTSLLGTEWENISINYSPSPVSPGQLEEHYRTKKPLRIILIEDEKIYRSYLHNNDDSMVTPLADSPELAARQLYGNLRLADKKYQDSSSAYLTLYLLKKFWEHQDWYPIRERLSKATSLIKNLE